MTAAVLSQLPTSLVIHLLAVGPPGPEQGKGSPWGVVITLFLVISVFFLGWSMQKHLKKIPKSFDEPEDAEKDSTGSSEGEPRP